jgi:hypothetical protein
MTTSLTNEQITVADLDQLEELVREVEGSTTSPKEAAAYEELRATLTASKIGALITIARRSLTSGAPAEHVAEVKTGKYANRLEWVSGEAMASTPVGTKLYAFAVHDAAAPSDLRDIPKLVAEYLYKHTNLSTASAVKAGADISKLLAGAAAKTEQAYVECRKCQKCDHIGINDASQTLAACHNCDWSGDSPVEDHCPGCGNDNCMGSACPECGALYELIADAKVPAPAAGAGSPQPRAEGDESAQEALTSITERLALTYRISCGTAPKQSIGELLDVTIKMPEWATVRAALARAPLPAQGNGRVPTEAMLNAARDWSVKKYGIGIGNDAAIGCWQAMYDAAPAQPVDDARDAELARLQALLNTPELHDFAKGVVLEAAHQRERWSTDHDAGKAPADWFWLLGYLGGKALKAHIDGNTEKALHHTISTAAACANWHAAVLGKTTMRPGIEPPADAAMRANDSAAEGGK